MTCNDGINTYENIDIDRNYIFGETSSHTYVNENQNEHEGDIKEEQVENGEVEYVIHEPSYDEYPRIEIGFYDEQSNNNGQNEANINNSKNSCSDGHLSI